MNIMLFVMVLLIWLVMVLFRNQWVFNNRTRILRNNYDKYGKLYSYDYMMWHFWIWDVEKFIQR